MVFIQQEIIKVGCSCIADQLISEVMWPWCTISIHTACLLFPMAATTIYIQVGCP